MAVRNEGKKGFCLFLYSHGRWITTLAMLPGESLSDMQPEPVGQLLLWWLWADGTRGTGLP